MYSFLVSGFFLLGIQVNITVVINVKSVFNDEFYRLYDQTLGMWAVELLGAKLRTTTNSHIITSSLSLTSPSWDFSA